MKSWSPDLVLEAWNFASRAHGEQPVPGTDESYLRHVGSVIAEIMSAVVQSDGAVDDPDLAVQCAALHDVLEDTKVTKNELERRFGAAVAAGVSALTKDRRIPNARDRMLDSLERISHQPVEVRMVKMADRIVNLQPPPSHWTAEKIGEYEKEARLILERFADANQGLARRLEDKIARYRSRRDVTTTKES